MLEWLKDHSDDASVHGARGDMAAVTALGDSWTAAEFNGVMDRTAWGDHFTLAALLGMLQCNHGIAACAKVRRLSGRVEWVCAPNSHGARPALVLELVQKLRGWAALR